MRWGRRPLAAAPPRLWQPQGAASEARFAWAACLACMNHSAKRMRLDAAACWHMSSKDKNSLNWHLSFLPLQGLTLPVSNPTQVNMRVAAHLLRPPGRLPGPCGQGGCSGRLSLLSPLPLRVCVAHAQEPAGQGSQRYALQSNAPKACSERTLQVLEPALQVTGHVLHCIQSRAGLQVGSELACSGWAEPCCSRNPGSYAAHLFT